MQETIRSTAVRENLPSHFVEPVSPLFRFTPSCTHTYTHTHTHTHTLTLKQTIVDWHATVWIELFYWRPAPLFSLFLLAASADAETSRIRIGRHHNKRSLHSFVNGIIFCPSQQHDGSPLKHMRTHAPCVYIRIRTHGDISACVKSAASIWRTHTVRIGTLRATLVNRVENCNLHPFRLAHQRVTRRMRTNKDATLNAEAAVGSDN